MAKTKKSSPKKSPSKKASVQDNLAKSQIGKKGFTFLNEFKSFALKGDMIDLAVGIIIGTGFNKLIQSLVNDMIMPVFGWLLGGTKFDNLYILLGSGEYETLADAQAAGAPVILYGSFISQVVDFTIIALVVFVVLRYFLRIKNKEEAK